MSKINKKSINYSLKLLTILAFGLIFLPLKASAMTNFRYVYGSDDGSGGYVLPHFESSQSETSTNKNPVVYSITPKYIAMGAGTKTITVVGKNFTPNSVVKINGSSRPTTFIDYSHLLAQLSASDLNRTEGFYLTVFDGTSATGEEYSNSAFFTVANGIATPTISGTENGSGFNFNTFSGGTANNTDSNGSGFNNFSGATNTDSNTSNPSNKSTNSTTTNKDTKGSNKNYGSLASGVIFGTNGFLPSGLVQWTLLAILILLIIILIRKVFGAEEEYQEAPMKHA